MEVKTARRISASRVKNTVCRYWLEGRCNKNPCRFMHRESPPPQAEHLPRFALSRNLTWKNPMKGPNPSNGDNGDRSNRKRSLTVQETTTVSKKGSTSSNGDKSNSKSSLTVQETATVYIERNGDTEAVHKMASGTEVQPKAFTPLRSESEKSGVQKAQPKQCKYWITGNCVHGDKCKDLHSWFCGAGYTMLARLEGHAKAITGISLPSGGDKLYSGGKDGIVRVWDCNNGQSVGSATMDSEIGCLVAESKWLFAGVQNGVKVWDLQNHTEFFLNGRAGLVCSVVMNEEYDKLFAGMEDGTILVWKWHLETKNFEPAAVMKEHKGAVRSLVVGAGKLYSGSTDSTIKVWEMQNFQCLQTLRGHTKHVTSVLCWDRYLLSASLDNTLKVWAATENGTIEMVHEIKVDHSVITLCGIHDAGAKHILLSSFSDNTVRLYDLPSFTERGRIFSKVKVNAIQIGVDGLFFTGDATGDATGEVRVWKLLGDACTTAS